MDKYLRYALEILLHRTSPLKILNNYSNGAVRNHYFMAALDEDFERRMRMEYGFLSIDEIHNASKVLRKECERDEYAHCGIFTTVFQFAEKTLWQQNGHPCVKFDQLLCFRDTTHTIGSELFICAYLANRDYFNKRVKRKNFDYPTSLTTDNIRLHNMLKAGLSENHFHLKGSTPAFMLSWLCLMNNVKNRKNQFDKINLKKTSLNSDMLFIDMQANESYYSLVIKAAAIRLFLTKELNKKYAKDEKGNSFSDNLKKLKELLGYNDIEMSSNTNKIQREIDSYKMLYSVKINKYNAYMDYAIEDSQKDNSSCVVFTGERKFLYDMFYAIISRNENIKQHIDLFYVYLLISAWFRGELIQNNGRTGFANFEEYQNRKDKFIEGYSHYQNALIAIALESNLEKDYIKSIEARFVPQKRSRDIRFQVALYDKLAGPYNEGEKIDKFLEKELNKKESKSKQGYRLFYVAHFPKFVDKKNSMLKCRHSSLRKVVKNQALCISYIRERQMEAACRILGIDACANEIGCRPEVFAQPFRFLKNHNVQVNSLIINTKIPKQLRITYHVGEDFLDVADGLRAIDEAINFLGITSGDRLGHALALGISAGQWYRTKNHRIILPRQDVIDNAAWMVFKLSKYGYSNKPIIYELKSMFQDNFLYVYQSIPFQERDHYVDIDMYIDSWKLRGDNPYLYLDTDDHIAYRNIIKRGWTNICTEYDCYNRNDICNSNLQAIRENNVRAYKLMHHYHFNKEVRKFGDECIEYEISKKYIEAVELIQEHMRHEIAQMGVGIECNPSSNYLIGTFKRYDQHPITNFNNKYLCNDNNNAKLFISINTDDLGVFDTSLENEYALMACALQKIEDESGNKKYSPSDIYDYLDYVRKMGLEQSFDYLDDF